MSTSIKVIFEHFSLTLNVDVIFTFQTLDHAAPGRDVQHSQWCHTNRWKFVLFCLLINALRFSWSLSSTIEYPNSLVFKMFVICY